MRRCVLTLVLLLSTVALAAQEAVDDSVFSRTERLRIDDLFARLVIPALKDDATAELVTIANQSENKIKTLMDERRIDDRLVAVKLAGLVSDPSTKTDLLSSRILPPDESLDVRADAVEQLASIRDPIAFFALIDALDDSEPTVRASAIGGIGALRDPRALDILLSALVDTDATVRIATAGALETLNDDDALAPLRARLEAETDLGVRNRIGQAIQTLSGEPPVEDTSVQTPSDAPGAASDPLGELKRIGGAFSEIGSQLQDETLETAAPESPTVTEIRARQDEITASLSRLIQTLQDKQSQSQQSKSKKEQYERDRPQPQPDGKQKQPGQQPNQPAQQSQLSTGSAAAGEPGKVSGRAADWIQLDEIEKELQTEMRLETIDPRYGRLLRAYIEAILEKEK